MFDALYLREPGALAPACNSLYKFNFRQAAPVRHELLERRAGTHFIAILLSELPHLVSPCNVYFLLNA